MSDPALVSPNDLVAVGPEQFYVTNDHRYTGGFKRTVEEYARQAWSIVLFYTGTEFVEAASGLGYANGINVSADGRQLYVCATVKGLLHVYDRGPITNKLCYPSVGQLSTALLVCSHPQNIKN